MRRWLFVLALCISGKNRLPVVMLPKELNRLINHRPCLPMLRKNRVRSLWLFLFAS